MGVRGGFRVVWRRGVVGTLLLVLVCGWLVVVRSAGVGVYGSDGGDIATWIFVHEWMSRGVLLYRDVWEHKDVGFLLLTQPFYWVGSTLGLYVSGVVSALVLGVGVLVGVRRGVSRLVAIRVACVWLALYVLSPTFLSVYKESYAVAFGVLAVSVVGSKPLLGGALIGVSTAIKVSGVGILALVVVVMVVEEFAVRRCAFQAVVVRLVRLLVGFGVVIGLVSGWAYRRGILGSWMEVVRYNIEYSSYRREAFGEVADVRGLLALLSPGYDTVAYLVCLTVIGAVLTFVNATQRRRHETSRDTPTSITNPDTDLLYGAALLIATLAAIVSQTPPRFQHYTYFIGALIYVCALLTANILSSDAPLTTRHTKSLSLATTLLIAVSITLAVRADGPAWPLTNMKRWTELDTITNPIPELQSLPENSRIAFVNVGGNRINFNDLHHNTELGCKYFFHYPNLTPKYGQQMLDCLDHRIDYVILGTKAEMSETFTQQLNTKLRTEYIKCDSAQTLFVLWSAVSARCPSLYR